MRTSLGLLNQLQLPAFRPLPFLASGMKQTVAAAFWPVKPDNLEREIHSIALEDGDVLRIIENKPVSWKDGERIVVLIHGLAGHSKSPYMVRLTRKFYETGNSVLRVNLRGCGEGFGYAKNIYHSGRSEDVRQVLRWAQEKYPHSPVTLVGFSLGANITLKLVGEDGPNPTGNLESFMAISPPVNLSQTAAHLRSSRNLIFDQFFVWKLRADIARLHRQYPELPTPKIPFRINLTDIDDLYTAPRSGYKDAEDYYAQSSSYTLVPRIRIPGLILCSTDDPVIDGQAVAQLEVPEKVDLLLTEHGGHVGFLSSAGPLQWMDEALCKWVDLHTQKAVMT